MERAHNDSLVEPHDGAFRHCCDRRQASWLTRQTALAKEIPLPMEGDHGFLSLFGYDADLDFALLNVKDRIRWLALPEDSLTLSIFRNSPSPACGGEKRFDVEGGFLCSRDGFLLCFHDIGFH
jgi:hypothetical protein